MSLPFKTTQYTAVISFNPIVYDDNGCVYRKRIVINQKIFDAFKLALQSETALEKEHYRHMWLSVPISSKNNCRFLNLTQGSYFCKWISTKPEIEVNKKRLQYNHNTVLIIKK